MTVIDALKRKFTTCRSDTNPGTAMISQSDQKIGPDQFDPAEFPDRIACGEYRGNFADAVDRLTYEQRLAAALLPAESVEARRRQRRTAEVMKRQQTEQQTARSPAAA